MQDVFHTTNDRPITGNIPRMQFCYDKNPVDFHKYYLPTDLPGSHPPIPHRPTWKGVGAEPNLPPKSMIDTQERTNYETSNSGFLPHKGGFAQYSTSIDNESSLRNLDQRLTKSSFGQRIMMPQATNNVSHSKMGVSMIPNYRAKGFYQYQSSHNGISCGLDRKYDESSGMNQAMFNNSTRLTTKNLVLPHVEPASDWCPQVEGKIGNVPVRRP